MYLTLIQNYLKPASILDIGANVGDFTKECKLTFPTAEYLLIEGNPACEPYLKNLGHTYFIGLLSDEPKTVKFYINKNNLISTGNSIYRENTEHFSDENIIIEELQTTTLDSVVDGKVYDLIKIDVQGSELDVLRGGVTTVQEAKAIILELSLIEYNKNSASYEDVTQYMESIGYVPMEKLYEHFDGQGNLIQLDVLFLNRRHYDI